jgi:hypothetical protein
MSEADAASRRSASPAASARQPDRCRRPVKKQIPQKGIDDFWRAFTTRFPGKVGSILPRKELASAKARRYSTQTSHGEAAHKNYDDARGACTRAVLKIAKECRRVNTRYRDPHFDMDFDLKYHINDCLEGLIDTDAKGFAPKSVKRVPVRATGWAMRPLGSDADTRKSSRTHNSTWGAPRTATCARAPTAIAGSYPRCAPSRTCPVSSKRSASQKTKWWASMASSSTEVSHRCIGRWRRGPG